MASLYCERADCYNKSFTRCGICASLDLPAPFGQYCSRDCQVWCYQSHGVFHKALNSSDRHRVSFTGIVETIALALKDASLRRLLPPIRSDGVIAILLTGCRDATEGAADYIKLYELIVQMEIYPPSWIHSVEITLSGPELTSHIPYCHPSGKLKVFRLCGRLQRLFPPTATSNPAALDGTCISPFSTTSEKVNVSHYGSFNAYNGAPALAPAEALWNYCCVIVRHPGYSHPKQKSADKHSEPTLLEQWKPAMELLLQREVLVITTGYSEQPAAVTTTPAPISPMESQTSYKTAEPNKSSPPFDRHPATGGSPAIHTINSPDLAAGSQTPSKSTAGVNVNNISQAPSDAWTHDAVQDEHILDTVFHANIVIPRTRNSYFLPRKPHTATTHSPSSMPSISSAENSPSTATSTITLKKSISVFSHDIFYMAFQGRRHPAVTKQIAFYTFMAKNNAMVREIALQLAQDIGGGRLRLPIEMTSAELELHAHGLNHKKHPFEKQLLQHEILAQQKQSSPGTATDAGSKHTHTNTVSSAGTPSNAPSASVPLLNPAKSAVTAPNSLNNSPYTSVRKEFPTVVSQMPEPVHSTAIASAGTGSMRVRFSDSTKLGGASSVGDSMLLPNLPQLTFTRK